MTEDSAQHQAWLSEPRAACTPPSFAWLAEEQRVGKEVDHD